MSQAVQEQPKQQQLTVAGLMASPKVKDQIALALPKHMNSDRMARIALTEIRKNPELEKCDPMSFLGAVIQCAQLGLEPGSGLGHAYLVPFYNSKRACKEVQFIPGYRGLIDLARRSGHIQTIAARCVYENDEFDYSYGLEEKLVHKPAMGERGDLLYIYAVAKLKDGGTQMEVMSRDDVERIRDLGAGAKNPVWKTHFDEMARKTAVRRLVKYLPLSPEMGRVLELDDAYEAGRSQDVHAIVDPDYVPAAQLSEDATTIKQVLDEARDGAEQKLVEQLATQIELRINALVEAGEELQKISEKIGAGSSKELRTLPKERLTVILGMLRSWQ